MDQDGANNKFLIGNELVLTQDLIQLVKWLYLSYLEIF